MVYALEDNIPLNYRDIIMQTTEKKNTRRECHFIDNNLIY